MIDAKVYMFRAAYGLTQRRLDDVHHEEHKADRIVLVEIHWRRDHVVEPCREHVLLNGAEFPEKLHLADGLFGFILIYEDVLHKFDGYRLISLQMNCFDNLTVSAGSNFAEQLVVILN